MVGSSETLVGLVLILLLGCYLQSGPRVGSLLTPAQLRQVSGAHQRLSRAYMTYLFLGTPKTGKMTKINGQKRGDPDYSRGLEGTRYASVLCIQM